MMLIKQQKYQNNLPADEDNGEVSPVLFDPSADWWSTLAGGEPLCLSSVTVCGLVPLLIVVTEYSMVLTLKEVPL